MMDTLTIRLSWGHIILAFLFSWHNCHGQGQSAFANNPIIPVFYEESGNPASPEVTVGLYYSGDLEASQDALMLGGTTQIITAGISNNGSRQ